MLNPSELFLVYIFLWLFLILGTGLLVTFTIILRHRKEPERKLVKKIKSQQLSSKRKKEPIFRSQFAEKLGDKVVYHMIRVSRSQDLSEVRNSIAVIRGECERLNKMSLPAENKNIISTVLLWANKFDIERHMAEMKIFRRSTQIVYDPEKRDFKLRVKEE
jgi:hypothetical protein